MFEMLYLFKIGIVAGVIMGMAAMFLKIIKFTTLDLTKYVGCLLTGQSSGRVNFIAGFVAHLGAAVFFAFVYNYVIRHFKVEISGHNAVYFGIIHTLIAGALILPLLDRMNPCVAQGSIKRMSYFASGYGIPAVITYVIGHIVYAFSVFVLLGFFFMLGH